MNSATQNWLEAQCKMVASAHSAMLVLLSGDQTQTAEKHYWPNQSAAATQFEDIVNQVIQQKASVFIDVPKVSQTAKYQASSIIGYPIYVNQTLIAVIVFEVSACSLQDKNALQQVIDIGGIWLDTMINQEQRSNHNEQLLSVFGLTSTVLSQSSFQASATALTTELATKLSCSRVSIGVSENRTVKLKALSHSAVFNKKNELIKNIESVMVEAFDVQDTLIFSTKTLNPEHVVRAHKKLSVKYNNNLVCSIPLVDGDEIFGVLTLEKESSDIAEDFKDFIETVSSVAGPILALKHKQERSLIYRSSEVTKGYFSKLFGPKNFYIKFATCASLAVVALLSISSGVYKVSADAYLEGLVQRAVVAPIDGYIQEASVRAGDVVSEGDLLAILDDKDLRIEKLKWESEKSQRTKQYRLALAKYDRSQARILSAQIQQAEAKVSLIEEQIKRTKIIAPLNGVVVSGDLSQELGAPVRRGDDLFEVAMLDEYRVVLNVDEREIGEIETGQIGKLILSGMPQDSVIINVNKITPVSVVDAGQNYFRVEASINGKTIKMRPGMKGIAKIEIEKRRLIWIWTHKLVNWLRIQVWGLLS